MKQSLLAQHNLQATVCNWSGTPLVMANGFAGTSIANSLAKAHHPIFDLTLTELMRVTPTVLRNSKASEQWLLALALCHSSQLWVFDHVTFYPQLDKAEKLLQLVIDTVQIAIHAPVAVAKGRGIRAYPQMRVTSDTNITSAIAHLKLVKDTLAARAPLTQEERLDWELDLERELNQVLQRGSGYKAAYGRNMVQTMRDAYVRELCNICDVELMQYCLNPETSPRKSQLEEAIELINNFGDLADEFARSETMQVMRFIERRIELIVRDEQAMGFGEIVEVAGAGTKVADAGTNYTVRTGFVESSPVAQLKTSVVEEVRAEWKALGKQFTQLQLVMEANKRNRAAQAATTEVAL